MAGRPMEPMRWCRFGAVAACISMLGSAGVACAQLQSSSPVTQDGIVISLPIFMISLITTASLTWKVAKYDSKKNAQLLEAMRKVAELEEKLEKALGVSDVCKTHLG